MLLGTLGASLLRTLSTGKGTIKAGKSTLMAFWNTKVLSNRT